MDPNQLQLQVDRLLADLTGQFVVSPRKKELIEKLPSLTEHDLERLGERENCCPICFATFLAVLATEEMAHAMDSPAVAMEELGVTRLVDTCGHVFCRKDISTWIAQNDSCPTCRRPFLQVEEPSERSPDEGETNLPEGAGRLPPVNLLDILRGAFPDEFGTTEGRQQFEYRDEREDFAGLYS